MQTDIFLSSATSVAVLTKLFLGLFAVTYIACTTMPQKLGIVYPHLIESRKYDEGKVIRISDSITLNLKKSSLVSRDFLLRTYQDDVMEHNYLDGEILEEDLYHDAHSSASVIVLHENGLKVVGIVGPGIGIKPMLTEERTADGSVPHVLYELAAKKTRTYAARSARGLSSVYSVFYAEKKRRPSKVYLELMILVDSTFRQQFATKDLMLRYLLITMNAVNMKFLTVSDPEVQIILRAVEVFNRKVESNFLVRNGSNYIKDRETLFALQKYVIWNYEKYYTFDALYFITGLDMAYYNFGGWDADVQGVAFIGGVCTIDKIGMGEDKADTYSGVRVTAHELGHLLGCPHDGEQYRFFSSKNCSKSYGFLMTYSSNSSRSMKFSPCCNQAISELARSPYGDCLETKNATRRINKKHDTHLLPGQVLKRDQVCKLAFPTLQDIRFVTDNGTARCYASCYSSEANKTLRTILPDHSRCNETSIEGIQSRHMVCVNGDCRTIRSKYPVEPVKTPLQQNFQRP